jgi:hypothetical protein
LCLTVLNFDTRGHVCRTPTEQSVQDIFVVVRFVFLSSMYFWLLSFECQVYISSKVSENELRILYSFSCLNFFVPVFCFFSIPIGKWLLQRK